MAQMSHQDALSGGTQKGNLGELARASLIIADRRTEAKNRGGLMLAMVLVTRAIGEPYGGRSGAACSYKFLATDGKARKLSWES
jgi:hypothetical protein